MIRMMKGEMKREERTRIQVVMAQLGLTVQSRVRVDVTAPVPAHFLLPALSSVRVLVRVDSAAFGTATTNLEGHGQGDGLVVGVVSGGCGVGQTGSRVAVVHSSQRVVRFGTANVDGEGLDGAVDVVKVGRHVGQQRNGKQVHHLQTYEAS